ncbi:hypothetical protein Q7O_001758 [Pectobacterium carotovorum subsp. carotovorum PCCS1]|nr:hypothetical protein [Pectobacterium carotovorum subsp. carotovorum PCCS1]
MAEGACHRLHQKVLGADVMFGTGCHQAGRHVGWPCSSSETVCRDSLAVGTQSGIVACCCRACSSSAGSFLPRRAARIRMPAHAVALKKYFAGIEVVSTTCHKKHTLAALGDTEVLGVEHPPREATAGSRHVTCVRPFFPWRVERMAFSGQCAQQAAKGVGAVTEHARDVFPDDRGGGLMIFETDLVDDIGKLHVAEG